MSFFKFYYIGNVCLYVLKGNKIINQGNIALIPQESVFIVYRSLWFSALMLFRNYTLKF